MVLDPTLSWRLSLLNCICWMMGCFSWPLVAKALNSPLQAAPWFLDTSPRMVVWSGNLRSEVWTGRDHMVRRWQGNTGGDWVRCPEGLWFRVSAEEVRLTILTPWGQRVRLCALSGRWGRSPDLLGRDANWRALPRGADLEQMWVWRTHDAVSATGCYSF